MPARLSAISLLPVLPIGVRSGLTSVDHPSYSSRLDQTTSSRAILLVLVHVPSSPVVGSSRSLDRRDVDQDHQLLTYQPLQPSPPNRPSRPRQAELPRPTPPCVVERPPTGSTERPTGPSSPSSSALPLRRDDDHQADSSPSPSHPSTPLFVLLRNLIHRLSSTPPPSHGSIPSTPTILNSSWPPPSFDRLKSHPQPSI